MAGRNMEITVAKTAGFCFGVKRAVEKVYDQIATGKKPIYTYGPIIHNEEVVRDLEEKGVQVINSKEELEALKEGVVVIRSHGVGREIYELLECQGLELVDATCPFVKKIHNQILVTIRSMDQLLLVQPVNAICNILFFWQCCLMIWRELQCLSCRWWKTALLYNQIDIFTSIRLVQISDCLIVRTIHCLNFCFFPIHCLTCKHNNTWIDSQCI